jgi:benzoyl-CoA reductase/2-hydroxyglutaryl-CoA dehydratase subunit BcrC/BadD/HgdB
VISGGICSIPDILDIVEESGDTIVWDDLCTGARYFNAPLFIFDTPFCHTGFPDEAKTYVIRQVKACIAFLETERGTRFDHDRKKTDFIATMAEGYSRGYLNVGVDEMAETVIDMIDKYDADGVVMHSNRSCKPYSLGQMDIMEIVQEKRNLPALMIEADIVDERRFSERQIETRIDAFIEVLKKRKDCG